MSAFELGLYLAGGWLFGIAVILAIAFTSAYMGFTRRNAWYGIAYILVWILIVVTQFVGLAAAVSFIIALLQYLGVIL